MSRRRRDKPTYHRSPPLTMGIGSRAARWLGRSLGIVAAMGWILCAAWPHAGPERWAALGPATPPQEPATSPPPAPPPLSLRIEAPVDTIAGNWVPLRAITSGEASAWRWTVISGLTGQQGQPTTPGLVILPPGREAYFTHAVPGDYLVSCAVANLRGEVELSTVSITLLSPPPAQPLTLQTIAEITPQTDLAAQHRAWVAEVASDERVIEAGRVAESFRTIVSLLEQDAVEEGADPLLLVERAAEEALGPAAFAPWESYFARVRQLAEQLHGAQALETPRQFSVLFGNLAALLDEVRGR